MATVSYYLRSETSNSKIQIQLSISSKLKLRTTTNLSINYKDWSKDTQFPKQNNPENKKLATILRELSNYILNQYNKDFEKGVIFNSQWLKDNLNNHFKRIDTKVDDSVLLIYLKNYIEFKESISEYTECTIRKLKNLQERFKQYEKKKKKTFLIKDIDSKTLIDFRNFLIVDCNMMETTATRFIKNLKTVIFDAENNNKQINPQVRGFSAGTTNTEHKVFLSFEELEKIKEVQTINKELEIAKDWLIVGCYLGQRASDLLRMNKKMIYTKTDAEGNSYRFIEITQQKTGNEVVIPLHDEVETILKKYDGDFPPRFANTQDSNTTLFNKHLKKVCEIAGIHDIVKGKVYNEHKKKNEIVEIEKCYLVS